MTMDEIRKYRRAEPFRPFVIHTADGRQFQVLHDYNIALSPTETYVVVPIEGEDALTRVRLEEVAHISLLDERKAG